MNRLALQARRRRFGWRARRALWGGLAYVVLARRTAIPRDRPRSGRGTCRRWRSNAGRRRRPVVRGRRGTVIAVRRWAIIGARRGTREGRRRRTNVGGGRRSRITRTYLHGSSRMANDAPCAVQHRLRSPVTVRPVKRLRISRIDDIPGRPRGEDGAGDHGAADDAGSDARRPSSAAPPPSRTPPLSSGVRRGQRPCDIATASTGTSLLFIEISLTPYAGALRRS